MTRKDNRIRELEEENAALKRENARAPFTEIERLQKTIDGLLAEKERKRAVDLQTVAGQIHDAYRDHSRLQFQVTGRGETILQAKIDGLENIEAHVPAGFMVISVWNYEPFKPLYDYGYNISSGEQTKTVRGWEVVYTVEVESADVN